ncbi:MAG: glycosyltransferase family 4 protein [Pyrinomonadaceae bacterium]
MKDKETLWVITELYYPEVTSTGYYLTGIAEGLARNFRVKVICGPPNYQARGEKVPARETHKGVEIRRVRATTLNKNVILFKLINMVTLGASIFFKALLDFRSGERVLVVTTPPSLPFVTALASLIRGTSYVLLIHDNYPEILVAAGKTRENSFLVRFLGFCNRWLYKYAAKIIVVGRDMERLLEEKTRGLDIPLKVIQNWAELDQVEPAPREENGLLQSLGLEDRLVFLYAGNMGYPNDLESIVECAARLREDERFHFLFLGTGVKRNWLEKVKMEKGLENLTLLDPRPRSEQKIFLNACDVALVSLVRKMRGVSMPSRTYNILAAGKPILAITEKDSELDRVVREEGVGWVVPADEPDKLFEIILEIFSERNEFEEMGKRARRAALEKYSPEAALKKYREALNASDNAGVC